MRVTTMSFICVTAFVPVYLPNGQRPTYLFTCPFPKHEPHASTERVEAPKLVIAVAVVVYSFLA